MQNGMPSPLASHKNPCGQSTRTPQEMRRSTQVPRSHEYPAGQSRESPQPLARVHTPAEHALPLGQSAADPHGLPAR
jgi:hypothetical protein